MKNKIIHIKNLIHFALADGHLHDKELELIKAVGRRMGLENSEIEKEILDKSSLVPPLPENEVLRFMLFEDLLQIILADLKITNEEIRECKRVAKEMGFEEKMVDNLINKMQEHLTNGFIKNTKVDFLESEMYNLTINKIDNAKYY